jgi:hypothetical protein
VAAELAIPANYAVRLREGLEWDELVGLGRALESGSKWLLGDQPRAAADGGRDAGGGGQPPEAAGAPVPPPEGRQAARADRAPARRPDKGQRAGADGAEEAAGASRQPAPADGQGTPDGAAAEITVIPRAELERMLAQAREEGREQGLAEGRRERDRLAAEVARLEEALRQPAGQEDAGPCAGCGRAASPPAYEWDGDQGEWLKAYLCDRCLGKAGGPVSRTEPPQVA